MTLASVFGAAHARRVLTKPPNKDPLYSGELRSMLFKPLRQLPVS